MNARITQQELESYLWGAATILRGLGAHTPAQVDRREPGSVLRAQFAQPRKHGLLQSGALGDEVGERGADQDPKGR